MDIRTLQYFLAVAREENITKAANSLRITQPPLSRQLKDLEIEVGKKLFIRGNKKIILTEDGLLLKKRAEEIISLMEKTKAELSSSNETVNGEIRIGSGETDAVSLIAKIAKNLQQKYPLIHYHIYSGDAFNITEKLDSGLIDFGLLIHPVDIVKYDFLKLPTKDVWGVLMRKDSILATQDCIYAKDLWDKPLILSHQTACSYILTSWLQKETKKLNIIATYDLLYNASRFVKMGLGYAISLDKLINTHGDSELCFRPLSPSLEADICIVWKRNQIFSTAASLFLEQLKENFTNNN